MRVRNWGNEKSNGQLDREAFRKWVCVCVRAPVHSLSACLFDEDSTEPVVLLQDNVCQAPSIWHVFDVEIQGAKAQPASVQSPAGHSYCCARAYMCIWECVRETKSGQHRLLLPVAWRLPSWTFAARTWLCFSHQLHLSISSLPLITNINNRYFIWFQHTFNPHRIFKTFSNARNNTWAWVLVYKLNQSANSQKHDKKGELTLPKLTSATAICWLSHLLHP